MRKLSLPPTSDLLRTKNARVEPLACSYGPFSMDLVAFPTGLAFRA